MSLHVFSEIFLHLTWHTDGNAPLLRGATEALVHNYLRNRCRQTKGVYFHAVGGVDDHVHVVVRIDPHVGIDELVGAMKGASSHEANKQARMKALKWQRGYGAVSFGRKQLPWVVRYVLNQREHHAQGTVQERLERIAEKPAKAGSDGVVGA